MAKDIVDIAISQLGYKEGAGNNTKYGKYTGANMAPWCHSFVSWCAYKAGESRAVPKTASTDTGMAWFKKKGRFKKKGSYKPKRGDIVYFKTGRSHVGIVEKTKGNTLHTVEGNTSNKVARRTYSLSNSTITGYGVPNYKHSGTVTYSSYTTKTLNGKKVKAKFTGYYPANNSMEGGFYADNGEKLNYKKKTCAAPKSIPFNTQIQVLKTGTKQDEKTFRVNDRGGAIKVVNGVYHFDLLFKNKTEANNFGVRTGYAIIGNGTGYKLSSKTSKKYKANNTTSAAEKKYLKRLAKSGSTSGTAPAISGKVVANYNHANVDLQVLVSQRKSTYGTVYQPAVEELSLTLERSGTPGKCTFKVYKDNILRIQKGNMVRVIVDNYKLFYGFVFTTKETDPEHLEITAYDQLRYFKYKSSYTFKKAKASTILRTICKDHLFHYGTIADTKYKLPKIIQQDKTLLDTMGDVLAETTMATGKIFVLYDQYGKITLQDASKLRLDCVVDKETAQGYSYESSIDGNTYNYIVLKLEDQKGSFVSMDSGAIEKWGMLKYVDTLKDPSIGKIKADALRNAYSRLERKFTVNDVFGDPRVKAGFSVPVIMSLHDKTLKHYMMVEKVTHKFKNREHTMDLTLRGAGISG